MLVQPGLSFSVIVLLLAGSGPVLISPLSGRYSLPLRTSEVTGDLLSPPQPQPLLAQNSVLSDLSDLSLLSLPSWDDGKDAQFLHNYTAPPPSIEHMIAFLLKTC